MEYIVYTANGLTFFVKAENRSEAWGNVANLLKNHDDFSEDEDQVEYVEENFFIMSMKDFPTEYPNNIRL